MNKLVIEGEVGYKREDGGQALIAELESPMVSRHMFVRLQSWDEKCFHLEALQFQGKRVRVTIEVIE